MLVKYFEAALSRPVEIQFYIESKTEPEFLID